jgi:hypothetical protein
LICNVILQNHALPPTNRHAALADCPRGAMSRGTLDPDFPQPAPFHSLTDIAAVLNNQLGLSICHFLHANENRPRMLFFSLRIEKTQP